MQGRSIGRYVLGPQIASGGMASVHLARMLGDGGFGKTVAMKCLHAQYGSDPEFVTLFKDEARLTSALTHANIVMTLDVLEEEDGVYLVMEYVHGASLSQIHRRNPDSQPLPLRISVGIVAAMLDGLHAAHEAVDEHGEPLDIIHRDVSPQNVLVTFQGVAKLADFGIAKAAGRVHSTEDGSLKGKIGYMAPEQFLGHPITPRTDIYSAGVVLWETITGRRLIDFPSMAENVHAVLELPIEAPSTMAVGVTRELDEVVMRAIERVPAKRFASAREMGAALRRATDVAHSAEIGDWLRSERRSLLEMRDKSLAELQRAVGTSVTPASVRRMRVPYASVPNIALEEETASEGDQPSHRSVVSDSTSNPSYWTGTRPPPPRARWLFSSLTLVLAMGAAAATLVLTARRPSPNERTSGSSTAYAQTSSALASAAPSEAPAPMIKRSESVSSPRTVEANDSAAPATDASAAASASSGNKPSRTAPAPSPSRRCRIVPSTNSAGHTTFTEVCQ